MEKRLIVACCLQPAKNQRHLMTLNGTFYISISSLSFGGSRIYIFIGGKGKYCLLISYAYVCMCPTSGHHLLLALHLWIFSTFRRFVCLKGATRVSGKTRQFNEMYIDDREARHPPQGHILKSDSVWKGMNAHGGTTDEGGAFRASPSHQKNVKVFD